MKLNGFLMTMALLSTSAAQAQIGGHGAPGPRGGGFGMHQRKVVTGAPYSADVTDTSVRTLPDSNTIQHTTTGHFARDSEGRTYSLETVTGGMFGQSGPKTFIFISDPVAKYSYTLNPDTKTATRRALHVPGTGAGFAPQHVAKERPADANMVETALPAQVMNGVSVEGKKMTHTIPAGTIGNAMPIVSTSERWYSTELQAVVFSKRTDAREGVSTYSLTNIQKAEPSAALFQVPADYTIKDATRSGGFGSASPQ